MGMDMYAALLGRASSGGGGGGGALVVHFLIDEQTVALDKTWQEIYDAFMSGANCIIEDAEQGTNELVTAVNAVADDYYVVMSANGTFIASSANGYPAPD